MTREKAIKILKRQADGYYPKTTEALNMAIKSLEQEPCEDAISRENLLLWLDDIKDSAQKHIGFLLDVQRYIRSMPTVTSQPKTGHWIPSHIPESILDECSECGFPCGAFTFNYCPDCGTKMIKPQESEE